MTCHARLAVRHPDAIGAILECPKCGSMVEVHSPAGWQPPQAPENSAAQSSPEATAVSAGDSAATVASGNKWAFLGLKPSWLWIVSAPAAAAVLSVVTWWALFSGSNSDNPAPPATLQQQNTLAQAADNSVVDLSKNGDKPESKQPGASNKSEPITVAASNPNTEPSAESATENTAKSTTQPSNQPTELSATEANTREGDAPVVKTAEAKSPEASASAHVKDKSVETAPVQNQQSMPSYKSSFKLVKPIAPEKIDAQSRLGDVIPGIDLRDMPFAQAIGLVAALSGLPITIDPDAMERLGVTLHDPITLKLTNATLEEILQELVAKRAMAYLADDGQILITATADDFEQLRRVRYTVSDLTGGDQSATNQLATLVQKFIAPESWKIVGGWGTIETEKSALIVTQNSVVQDKILVFCEKLRNARGRPLRSSQDPARFELTTRLNEAGPALNRRISANFHEPATLVDILTYLGRQAEVDILLDRRAMGAAGLSDKSEISLVAHDQPLAEVLKELLQPLKLAYRAVDAQTLQVTTQSAVDTRLDLEFYPVGKLLGKELSGSDLAEQIKSAVAPDTWKNEGKSAAIYFDQPSNALIISQSQPVQGAIQEFLAKKIPAK